MDAGDVLAANPVVFDPTRLNLKGKKLPESVHGNHK